MGTLNKVQGLVALLGVPFSAHSWCQVWMTLTKPTSWPPSLFLEQASLVSGGTL